MNVNHANRPILIFVVLLTFCTLLATHGLAEEHSTQNLTDFSEAEKTIAKPQAIWPILKKEHVVPMEFTVRSDEIVTSDTDPSQKLHKVTAHFWSQKIDGKKWGHPCVIYTPADNSRNMTPPRRGKVVIVSAPSGKAFPIFLTKYGESIAARTGYPTMVLANPGEYADGSHIERDIRRLGNLRKTTGKGYYNMNCQLAVVYIQAMNAFQKFLGVKDLKAVLGGHSKRGRSAPVAAAMDSRVASAIIMGNEGMYLPHQIGPRLSFYYPFFQEQVDVPVFYLGATNEDGYAMFNISIQQKQLKRPMTIEMVPNYVHSTFHEIQYMDVLMWVAHTFNGRPISQISDLTCERKNGRSIFRAKVTGGAKIQTVKTWYVYTNDPAWRDLMWFHLIMEKVDDHYEATLGGKIPDAFMVEVGDIAQGIPGYVSSVPQKLTDAPVVERKTRGSIPRLWKPNK